MTPTSSRHGKNRQYRGEPFGTRVANWLNGKWEPGFQRGSIPVRGNALPPTRAVVARIAKLIQLFQAAINADGKLDGRAFQKPHNAIRPYRFRALPSWQTFGAEYVAVDHPRGAEAGPLADPPAKPGRFAVTYLATGRPLGEGVVIYWLFALAQEGLHHRLRRCQQCGKWVFAHFDTQTFCAGGVCRKAHRAQDEAYAELHRKRMRERYWDIKTGKCKPQKRR